MATPTRTVDEPEVLHATASVADAGTATAAPPTGTAGSSAPPVTANRYVLGEEIARGGMGEVYRATDTVLNREVAVKVLQAKYAPTSGSARRFADEARITGQLQHPNIPAVHDLGTLPDGRPFLAMKLIKGQTLDHLLKDRPNPSVERGRFVAIFEAICQGVAYAHAHGVIHRDLKPQNIMVGSFGEVQVMDWGLAKVLGTHAAADTDSESTSAETEIKSMRDSEDLLTQAGSVLGTPAYMPPEQALGAVHEIDARSDVFGLGGILAAILTGQPPFVGDTGETTRVLAAKGKVGDCFARLDASGADPELVALAKRCLAPEKDDRPANADAVAKAVAALRTAADERARQAELDKVRVEGEKAAAILKVAEGRKRRRVWIGAAAALTVAVAGGLAVVLVVQDRAKRDLEAKNEALKAEQAKVEQRFEMARKSIATFHTVITDEKVLENDAFKALRAKLLKEAARFYEELETLLAGETDAKSRKALADGYIALGELTGKIGNQREALIVYQKALAVRRELATVPGSDVEARLDVAISVRRVGRVMSATGDTVGALRAFEESRDIAAALEAESPTDAVRSALAHSHNNIGCFLFSAGKLTESLAAHETARDIRQKLVDANPAVTDFQSALASSLYNLGGLLSETGKLTESLAAHETARDIRQKLADANPTVTQFQSDLAWSHYGIGRLFSQTGKPADIILAANETFRDFAQKMADANPADTEFQNQLALGHLNIGDVLSRTGKTAGALSAYEKARDIQQKLADANPAVTRYQSDLAWSYNNIGQLFSQTGKLAEALAAHEKARDVRQKLADANPAVTDFQSDLARSYNNLGRLHASEGRFAEGFVALDIGLSIRQKLMATDDKIAQYTNDLGSSHAHRGWARVRVGHPAEAATDLRKAVELWAKSSAIDADDRLEKSRALALLAKLGADPKSEVTADEAKAFADKAVIALADAIKVGWGQLPELKEPDFDAVRGRDDFKKVVKELEEKQAAADRVAPPPRLAK